MRVALVKPPNAGSLVRGVGFYGERLFEALKKNEEIEVELVDYTASFNNYDLIHYVYYDLFDLTFPLIHSKKTVVTLHDVIPLKFPQAYPLGLRGKVIWPVKKILLKTVDGIITDSMASKADIIEIAKVPKDKINVTYLAADEIFKKITDPLKLGYVKAKYQLPKKFVLYVGGVNWNKNLITLVKACQEIRRPLVIVGKEATNEQVDLNHIENLPFKEFLNYARGNDQIQRLGYVPTQDLVGIYNLASVYCQPSIYEGFGLPVLEAMSCDCPVVCGENSSLVEIVGKAAEFANILDPLDLADKLKKAKKNSNQLVTQAKLFSWEKTALETSAVYKKILFHG